MPNSYVQYTSVAGGTTNFNVPFSYLDPDQVEVYIDDVLQTKVTEWDFTNATTIALVTPTSGGEDVLIIRKTEIDSAAVTFSNAMLVDTDLNTSHLQNFYLHQEVIEQLALGELPVLGTAITSGAASDGTVLTSDGAGGVAWETVAAIVGGLSDVVDDTTPQLGGNLDAQDNNITDVNIFTSNRAGVFDSTDTYELRLYTDDSFWYLEAIDPTNGPQGLYMPGVEELGIYAEGTISATPAAGDTIAGWYTIYDDAGANVLAQFGFNFGDLLELYGGVRGANMAITLNNQSGTDVTTLTIDPDVRSLAVGDNFDITLGDNDQILFGDGNDFAIDWDGSNAYLQVSTGEVILGRDGADAISTQAYNGSGNTSGGLVLDHQNTQLDIGFNLLPTFNMNNSDTLEASHCGHLTGKDNTNSVTLTGPTSADLDFPVGGVCQIANFASTVDYNLADTASCTMYIIDGAAGTVTDIAGAATLGPGGFATLYRYSATAIYLFGSGLTA